MISGDLHNMHRGEEINWGQKRLGFDPYLDCASWPPVGNRPAGRLRLGLPQDTARRACRLRRAISRAAPRARRSSSAAGRPWSRRASLTASSSSLSRSATHSFACRTLGNLTARRRVAGDLFVSQLRPPDGWFSSWKCISRSTNSRRASGPDRPLGGSRRPAMLSHWSAGIRRSIAGGLVAAHAGTMASAVASAPRAQRRAPDAHSGSSSRPRVAEQLAEDVQAKCSANRRGGEAVAEIVQPDAAQPGALQRRLPERRQPRRDGRSCPCRGNTTSWCAARSRARRPPGGEQQIAPLVARLRDADAGDAGDEIDIGPAQPENFGFARAGMDQQPNRRDGQDRLGRSSRPCRRAWRRGAPVLRASGSSRPVDLAWWRCRSRRLDEAARAPVGENDLEQRQAGAPLALGLHRVEEALDAAGVEPVGGLVAKAGFSRRA